MKIWIKTENMNQEHHSFVTSAFLAAQVSQGLWAECGVMVTWPIVVKVKASYEWNTTHKNKTVTSTQTRNNRSLKTATQHHHQPRCTPNGASWTVADPPAKEENAARFRWSLLLIVVTLLWHLLPDDQVLLLCWVCLKLHVDTCP